MTEARTVLVADDQEGIRIVLGAALRARGHRVLEARDGREAVALARAERPDVALLDLKMPRLDGGAAAAQLRADPATAGLPLLALTAYPAPATRHGAEHFDRVLDKMIPVAALVAAVESAARHSRAPD